MSNPFKQGDKVLTLRKCIEIEATVRTTWNHEVQVRTADGDLLWRTMKTIRSVSVPESPTTITPETDQAGDAPRNPESHVEISQAEPPEGVQTHGAPIMLEPLPLEPDPVEPVTEGTDTLEPDPVVSDPVVSDPVVSDPVEPTTMEPTTMEPASMEPTTMEPASMEPTTMEPASMEPTTMEPAKGTPKPKKRGKGTLRKFLADTSFDD